MKSTVEQIRQRFDNDVERFSNLETGQSATVDATLALELIAQAASVTTPRAQAILDVGCGAGNYTLKLLESLPNLKVTLIDLSQPMLERAALRITPATSGEVQLMQGDIRDLDIGIQQLDIILAAAVLHHLREEVEWRAVFTKFYNALRPGGSIWIFDLVESSIPVVQALMRERYGQYLSELKDNGYRAHVFDYIDQEDTPRPLLFQLELLRGVGFQAIEVLHKNSCFAAFGGVKL